MPKASAFRSTGRVADAETIPYEDNTFDLVVGHAVLQPHSGRREVAP